MCTASGGGPLGQPCFLSALLPCQSLLQRPTVQQPSSTSNQPSVVHNMGRRSNSDARPFDSLLAYERSACSAQSPAPTLQSPWVWCGMQMREAASPSCGLCHVCECSAYVSHALDSKASDCILLVLIIDRGCLAWLNIFLLYWAPIGLKVEVGMGMW